MTVGFYQSELIKVTCSITIVPMDLFTICLLSSVEYKCLVGCFKLVRLIGQYFNWEAKRRELNKFFEVASVRGIGYGSRVIKCQFRILDLLKIPIFIID